jgi:hypothetical protein
MSGYLAIITISPFLHIKRKLMEALAWRRMNLRSCPKRDSRKRRKRAAV